MVRIDSLPCLLVVLGLALSASADADSPVRASMPDVAAAPGEDLLVGLQVSDLTGLGVTSCDLLITYDARILTAIDLVQSGTLTQGWLQAHRIGFVEGTQDTVGLIDIALATASQVPSGYGTLVFVQFSVSESALTGQVSPLDVVEAILNSGVPETTIQGGSVTIESALVGDFDGDCKVGFSDYLEFVRHYGTESGKPGFAIVYDLTGDGRISFEDFLVFAQHYLISC